METLAVLGARFIAALTMMRVARISLSSRGSTPCLASGAAYATPFGATISLHIIPCPLTSILHTQKITTWTQPLDHLLQPLASSPKSGAG